MLTFQADGRELPAQFQTMEDAVTGASTLIAVTGQPWVIAQLLNNDWVAVPQAGVLSLVSSEREVAG